MNENEALNQLEMDMQQTQEVEQTIQEAPETDETPTPAPRESSKEMNFRALREKAAQLERERNEALQRIEALERAVKQTQQSTPTTPSFDEEDEGIDINPDDYAEGKHVAKLQKQIRKITNELKSYKTQSETMLVEQRLKMQYPDFDAIVTKENLDSLRLTYPELYQTLSTSNNIYNAGVSAYTMLKRLGIAADEQAFMEKQQLLKNSTKPRSLNTVAPQTGDSPLSKANAFASGLTEDLRKKLYEEMILASKK